MTAYIVGGQYFETKMPLGTYEIRYASGDVWYGEKHLFGPSTSYAKADELFNFRYERGGYAGYTIELIMQAHGNLRTQSIGPAAF